MARSRNIKPGFFTNDVLGDLPPLARLLFAGMWCHADRQGRLQDRPKRLKAEILPYDECDVNGLIQCLHDACMVQRYVVDGIAYIQCVNFTKHQNPHIKEPVSEIPAPPQFDGNPVPAPDKNGAKTADSLLLIPDSPKPSKALSAKADYPPGFQKFWNAWPNTKRKGGRPECFRVWVRRKCEPRADEILAHVESMKASPQWKEKGGEFIPAPATYLNGERWDGADLDAPASGEKPWFINGWSGIVAAGEQHGLHEADYPNAPAFRAAVLKKSGITEAHVSAAEAQWK